MLATLVFLIFATPQAVRLAGNPIITPSSSPTIGANINGPSLVRAPEWVRHPLGKYYLYFANHKGKYIRLAFADHVEGPWKVYEPGTLRLEQVPACSDHIASPDVHVDNKTKKVTMYFHCPIAGGGKDSEQKTLVSSSDDGLNFTARPQILGPSYFRVFRWRGEYYAIARGGALFRSKDGVGAFEAGPTLLPADRHHLLRHAAVRVSGDVLTIFFSRIGDRPERILVSEVNLGPDWWKWKASEPKAVLQPEFSYEGADLPVQESLSGEATGRVRELRDPAVFEDAGRLYLVYSIAGESGLAIAEIR